MEADSNNSYTPPQKENVRRKVYNVIITAGYLSCPQRTPVKTQGRNINYKERRNKPQ